MKSIVLYAHRNKVYAPLQALTKDGFFVGIEPIYTSNLDFQNISSLISRLIGIETPVIATPSKDEYKKLSKQILKLMGLSTWNDLLREATSYILEFSKETTMMYVCYPRPPEKEGFDEVIDLKNVMAIDQAAKRIVENN